jgi:hypothetical protein
MFAAGARRSREVCIIASISATGLTRHGRGARLAGVT